jgi:transcriptional regulator with XRE-family HTH domain
VFWTSFAYQMLGRYSHPVIDAVATNVRRARHAGGVTQEELAGRSGLSSRYVGSIERGEVIMSIVTLVQLAGALKVEPAELLRLPPRRPRRR